MDQAAFHLEKVHLRRWFSSNHNIILTHFYIFFQFQKRLPYVSFNLVPYNGIPDFFTDRKADQENNPDLAFQGHRQQIAD